MGACPLVHWSTLTGANTLSHKWSLGQWKCQLCAVKPMCQCWCRTQRRRVEDFIHTDDIIWWVSAVLQVLFSCVFSYKIELRATNCQSSWKFLVDIHQLDRERIFYGWHCVCVSLWQPKRDRVNCWGPSAPVGPPAQFKSLVSRKIRATPPHWGAPGPWRYPRLWLFNVAFAGSFILWAPCRY